jgi:PAS domain S-box-containing protein
MPGSAAAMTDSAPYGLDTQIVPGSEWYWEQDKDFRFTRVVAPRERAMPDEGELAFTGCRWDVPGALPLNMTWEEHRAQLQRGLRFQDFQYGIFDRQGLARYFSVSGEPMLDAQGQVVGYRGTTRDITEEYDARRRLRDALAQLQIAAALGRLGAWTVDLSTGLIQWSEQVKALHETARDHVATLDQALEMYLPEYRELLRDSYERCAAHGTPYDIEVEAYAVDGQRVWVRVIGMAERDPKGKVVRIRGAFQDIQKQKAASEANRLLAERLTMTLESLTDGFLTVAADWRVTYLNDAAQALLNHCGAQPLGQNLWTALPQTVGTDFETRLRCALETGRPVDFEAYYEPLRIWLHVRGFPSSQGMAVSFTDITAARKSKQDVLQMNAELEKRVASRTAELEVANRELESFGYSVAHDLRAPLSVLAGYSQVLQETEHDKLSAKGQHYLARIHAAALQMDQMTQGMLEFARLSRAALVRKRLDLGPMARRICEQLAEREPQRKVRFSIAEGMHAEADTLLANQVLQNLLANAWKYTRTREQTHIEMGPGDKAARSFFVRDNGVGFDMEHAAKLFEPFHRLHAAHEFEGTGIGLATVHKIVARHGGWIRAEARPGEGACFHFSFAPPAAST